MATINTRTIDCKVITIEQLVELSKRINCSLNEAIAIGKEYGVGHEYICRLRTMLGYSVTNSYKLTDEQRAEIVSDYKANHRATTYYAKKYGVTTNDIISLLKSRNVYEGDPRKWSKIESMKVKVLFERNVPIKLIALQLHKSEDAVRSYIYRTVTHTKKPYRKKKDAA